MGMVEFKIVIANPKTGRCVQKEVKEENATAFLGKKVGEIIRGELLDLTGYEFKITGGSDYCGFPMRADVDGLGRKKILTVSGIGVLPLKKKRRKNKQYQSYPGSRQRRTVCGNTVHDKIVQINLTVIKQGTSPLGDEAPAEKAKEQPAQ